MTVARKMKIVFVIPSLVQGGAERQILELITRLPDRFESVLVLWHGDVHYRDKLPPGQPRYVLGTNRMTRGAFRRLVEIFRAERPDVVHCYLNRANFWGRLAAMRARVPVIVASCRARMIELRYLPFERWLSERSQLVLVNSRGIKNELVKLARVRPERIRVIHNFVDLEHFRPPTDGERVAARARHGFAAQTRVLLMPGRISVQKHQLGLLFALDWLARRGRLPSNLVVLLPGRPRAAIYDRVVARLVARPRLASIVRLTGVETDMRSLYWAADLLVLPSLWEGLPNVALEGQACGLPAILSHAANLDGIVAPGETGWEVPTGKKRPLVGAIEEALTLPETQLAKMRTAARARMERLFRPDRVLAETVATYDSLLDERSACAA